MATEASTTESGTAGRTHNGQCPAAPASEARRTGEGHRDAAPIIRDVCGYLIDSSLSKGPGLPHDSFLAIGPGGRGVVLKALEEDCLLKASKNSKGGLHPNIRERLGRVRELAHVGVANLHGVERDADRAWVIWEYVPGQTFDEFASAPGRTSRELASAARELVLTVEALHTQGIVHGAIKPGNVVVTPAGAVRLTHVSPYLYTDPDEDARAVIALLEESLFARREERSPLAKVLLAAQGPAASRDASPSLRRLGARLAAFLTVQDGQRSSSGDRPARSRDSGPRRRSLAGAAAVMLLGAAAAYGAWRISGRPPLQLPKALHETVDAFR
jgi:tRNA A-37 threonylcarbamoyl transferase component Bud32